MGTDLDLSKLSHRQKDALILTLLARLDEARTLIAELRARIDDLTRPQDAGQFQRAAFERAPAEPAG